LNHVRVGAGERRAEATEVLLRDLVFIPDEVHAGDFVLALSDGVAKESTIADYVVTEQLAACFDRALGLIKSTVETSSSRAAYLDGSFGSGKSHFMATPCAVALTPGVVACNWPRIVEARPADRPDGCRAPRQHRVAPVLQKVHPARLPSNRIIQAGHCL
jgi:hypothetical protein